MENFYITLMSNSSLNYFPQNKSSSFTVLLPQKICLAGAWAVALAEMHYNFNFFNVAEENNKIQITYDGVSKNALSDDISENPLHDDDDVNEVHSPSQSATSHKKKRIYLTQIEKGYYNNISDIILATNCEIEKCIGKKQLFSELMR